MTTEFKTVHEGTVRVLVHGVREVEFKADTPAHTFNAVDNQETREAISREVEKVASMKQPDASGAFDLAYQRGFWGTVEVFVSWRFITPLDEEAGPAQKTPAEEGEEALQGDLDEVQQAVRNDLEQILKMMEYSIEHKLCLTLTPAQVEEWMQPIDTAYDVLFG